MSTAMDVELTPPGHLFRQDFRKPEAQQSQGAGHAIKLLQVK